MEATRACGRCTNVSAKNRRLRPTHSTVLSLSTSGRYSTIQVIPAGESIKNEPNWNGSAFLEHGNGSIVTFESACSSMLAMRRGRLDDQLKYRFVIQPGMISGSRPKAW